MSARVNVDMARLAANLARFPAEAGLPVRAHVKGFRSPVIGARAVQAGAVGIAAHSAAEAQSYVEAGITDVVIAWPWREAWRATRFAELATRCRLSVHVDDAATVASLSRAAREHGVELGVRIEIDTGLHRVGVAPARAAELAEVVGKAGGLRLDGVTGYAAIVAAAQAADRFEHGRRQAELVVAAARSLRRPPAVVCVGGLPTAGGAASAPGVTELCAGAYPLMDAGLALLGVCREADVAISVQGETAELLAGADQVWAPGRTSLSTADGALLPMHVCPVVARRPLLHVLDGTIEVARWQTLVVPDRATAGSVPA